MNKGSSPILSRITFLGVAFLLIAATFLMVAFIFQPRPSDSKEQTVVLFIPPKSSVRAIARQLQENGVLTSTWPFKLLTRVTGKHKKLKPGEYDFPQPASPFEAFKILVGGKTLLHKVTIPEGYTVSEITNTLIQKKLINPKIFEEALSDKAFLKELQIPGKTFEGFLFPNTYFFSKTDGDRKIIRTLAKHFFNALTKSDREKAQQHNFSLLEWATLASIIEKESTWQDEQFLVSSVFHNRLRKKMRLQSDPTVIYGVPNFDGNLTKKHLTTHTPYNTYTTSGLPPGPIANPGASALHAAVNPAQTDFLYFVGDRKGRHVFAKTYKEHEKNVAYYQLGRKSALRKRKRR